MKVLIVSKFFYTRGGAEVVAIGTREVLLAQGHHVRVFAMSYRDNIDLPDAEGFASEVSFSGSLSDKYRGAKRIFGRDDVVAAAERVLDDFKPDVVHLHNVHSYLSPIIGELAHKRGIRVVWTLHDYKPICPAYSFRRADGTICTDCVDNNSPWPVVKHRCMKGSLQASILAWLEAKCWSFDRLLNATDAFICPSYFLASMMRKAGCPESKLHVVYNFIDPPKLDQLVQIPVRTVPDDYFCYIGRLSHEKGLNTLLKAAVKSNVTLKLAGTGPLFEPLKAKYADCPNIEFLGHLGPDAVVGLLNAAAASLICSEWYENNPLSVIESLCAGTPVIGANIGGIPELIPSECGVLFPSGDADALCDALLRFDPAKYDRQAIAANARRNFSQSAHFQRLYKIYSE